MAPSREDYSNPKRAAKSSLGLLVWCGFSHFLAETQGGGTPACSQFDRNVLACEYSR